MKKRNISLTAGFCIFTGVVCAGFFILPKTDFSVNEKRVLQSPPHFSLSSLWDGKFFASIDSFIADHFTGRDFWIGLNAYSRQAAGLNAANEIYRGKNGWLFERPLEDGKTFQDNINVLSAFVKQTDIPVTLLCVPTSGYMHPDKLPALHDWYPDKKMLEQLQDIPGIEWVPIASALQAEPDAYYRTDHHWTSKGAYTAYGKLAQLWGLEQANISAYDIKVYDGFYGTAYSKSGLWATEPDEITIWQDPAVQAAVTITDENKPFPVVQDSFFFPAHLQEADKYPVYLDGNHAWVNLVTNAPSGKLLIVRDSYAHCFAPFLARHFQQIDLIDLRYYKEKTVSETIAAGGYDKVLFLFGLSSIAGDRNLQWLE